jgi:ubiquinone biosynthesis protein COQ9
LRLEILDAALKHVPKLGWTVEALAAGAEDAGLPPVSHGIVERGAIELVEHFSTTATSEVVESAGKYFNELEEHIGMTDRIKYVTRKRLEAVTPYAGTWPEAMALGALPQNITHTVDCVTNTVDSLWKVCGDDSRDGSWYTKRGLLTGIYVSTELYMLTDTSLAYEDTWNYLDRQVDNIVSVGRVVGGATSKAKEGATAYGMTGGTMPQGSDFEAVASVVGANASSLFSTMTTMVAQAISEKESDRPRGTPSAPEEDEHTKKLLDDLENDPFFNGAPFEEGSFSREEIMEDPPNEK